VRSCEVCQRNKTKHLWPGGLLQPLPVPSAVWADVAMDFMEGVPRVNGKSVILTVIDRFSKYAHFLPLAHPYTATSIVRVFFDEIVPAWDPELHCQRQGPGVHQRLLARALSARRSLAAVLYGVSPTVGWPVRGGKQDHHDVPSLPYRRSAPPVAALASVGRVLLQLLIPGIAQDVDLSCGVRA
jgi:hypothetical protein